MNGNLIFLAIALSLVSLAYLNATDPKRRRTHALPKRERRPFLWPARVFTFGPGVLLTAFGDWSGLSIWAGAVTTLGWVMAAISPATYDKIKIDLLHNVAIVLRHTRGVTRDFARSVIRLVLTNIKAWRIGYVRPIKPAVDDSMQHEMQVLKRRISVLEARLEQLENEPQVGNTSETIHTLRSALEDAPILEKPLNAAE